jgi:hypothetical protein
MVAQPLYGTYRQRLIVFGNLYHLALCLRIGQLREQLCELLLRADANTLDR